MIVVVAKDTSMLNKQNPKWLSSNDCTLGQGSEMLIW